MGTEALIPISIFPTIACSTNLAMGPECFRIPLPAGPIGGAAEEEGTPVEIEAFAMCRLEEREGDERNLRGRGLKREKKRSAREEREPKGNSKREMIGDRTSGGNSNLKF